MKQHEKLPPFCCTSLRDSTPWTNSTCHSVRTLKSCWYWWYQCFDNLLSSKICKRKWKSRVFFSPVSQKMGTILRNGKNAAKHHKLLKDVDTGDTNVLIIYYLQKYAKGNENPEFSFLLSHEKWAQYFVMVIMLPNITNC